VHHAWKTGEVNTKF